MPTVFTNTTLYASLNDGNRTPVSRRFEDDDVPDVGGGGGATNPDPGGPGGGTDTGGDIGNIDGSGVTTVGNAPSITRSAHSRDIYAASGATVTLTYVADGDCTMIPKGSWEEFTVSYSDNGRSMTLTWTVPAGRPGDSTYIGAECWVYGGANTEAYTTIWDRLHINKTAGDVAIASQAVIYDAVVSNLNVAGKTVIIPDGDYSNDRDVIAIGFSNYLGTTASSVPNGVHTDTSNTAHTGASFTDKDVTKYNVIMSASPQGVKMLRNYRPGGITFYGNNEFPGGGNSGYRSTIGFKSAGFTLINSLADSTTEPLVCYRTQRCGHSYYSVVEDAVIGQTPLRSAWSGDGACVHGKNNAYTLMEYGHCIGNSRLLVNNSYASTRGNVRAVWRGLIATSACTQMSSEGIAQTFVSYGSHESSWHNCYGIDSGYFAAGVFRQSTGSISLNHTFAQTNGANNSISIDSCLALNDVRAGCEANGSGSITGINDKIKNSTFWGRIDDKVSSTVEYYYFKSTLTVDGVLVGKNQTIYSTGSRATVSRGSTTITNMMVASPSWGNDPADLISINFASVGKLGVASVAGGNFSTVNPTLFSSTSDFFSYSLDNLVVQGQKYVSRREFGSAIDDAGLGVSNIFTQIGRTGAYWGETGYDTRYDGTSAQYVNVISKMPWQEMRADRQRYSCTSNGATFEGNSGWAKDGVHPVDYINRFGTTKDKPINCPYIEDVHGKALGSGSVRIWWRPVCAAYRSTITGYHLYVDGIKVTTDSNPVPKESTSYTFTGVNTGTRRFNIVCIDPSYGNSGLSRNISITVT